MTAIGARKVANGELALIAGCAVLGRMDFDRPEHRILMEQCQILIDGLPPEARVVRGDLVSELRYALEEYRDTVERWRHMAHRNRNWIDIESAQGALRMRANDCHKALFARCFQNWAVGLDLNRAPGDPAQPPDAQFVAGE